MAVALNDVRFRGKSRHCGHVAFRGSIRAPDPNSGDEATPMCVRMEGCAQAAPRDSNLVRGLLHTLSSPGLARAGLEQHKSGLANKQPESAQLPESRASKQLQSLLGHNGGNGVTTELNFICAGLRIKTTGVEANKQDSNKQKLNQIIKTVP